jgi:hypothetical protein
VSEEEYKTALKLTENVFGWANKIIKSSEEK